LGWRRAGREALLWPKPFEWDAESDFTAWFGGTALLGMWGTSIDENTARDCSAEKSKSVRAVGKVVGRVVLRCQKVAVILSTVQGQPVDARTA
jgi:hypothetical protein